MKITKRQLKRIIKEEKARLLKEMHPRAIAHNHPVEVQEAIEELVSSPNTQVSFAPGSAEDEVYIMTGASEGITGKVWRRGR